MKTSHAKTLAVASIALALIACSANAQQGKVAPIIINDRAPVAAAQPAAQDDQTIDHVSPSRDSIGPAPTTFQWTAAKGADEYSMGIWNEVDRMVWRRDHIPGTTTTRPADVELEAGTYFWIVSALQGGRQIADSGMAAFVVKTPEP